MASSKLTWCPALCPPRPVALGLHGSWQPSPVCRCPASCKVKKPLPVRVSSSPGNCFSKAAGGGGGQGRVHSSGLVGLRTPLFQERNKLAALELSCLCSLVLAVLQSPSVAQKL